MRPMPVLGLTATFLLAACSGAPDKNQASDIPGEPARNIVADAASPPPDENADAKADKGTSPGGDPIEFASLSAADIPKLEGELGCGFSIGENKRLILIAKANIDPNANAFGVYKPGDSVEQISGGPGGYDKLANGMRLGGKGMTINIKRLSVKSEGTGSEGLSYPATLTANRADGGTRVYTGLWDCGP